MKLIPAFILVIATLFVGGHRSAQGQVVSSFNNYSSALGGTTADYQWSTFTSETRPAGVGASMAGTAGQWAGGIAPNNDPSSTTDRFSGTPGYGTETTNFLGASSGGGIYSFMSQTHFSLTSTSPVSTLESLVVQIHMAKGSDPAAVNNEFVSAPLLTLTTTLGTQTLATDFSLLLNTSSTIIFGNPTDIDLLGYQWDLSGISGTITGYSVDWQVAAHSITYGAATTESTATHTSSVLAVPEPSTYVMLMAGMGVLLWKFRRREMLS